MSNITIIEIAQICAEHIGTTIHDMSRLRGPEARKGAATALAMTAYLTRRHTRYSYADVAELFDTDTERIRKLGVDMRQRVIWSRATAQRISRIEDEIDQVHEARMELMSA
jgi:chromosomal replication initiation ATPase DnaA